MAKAAAAKKPVKGPARAGARKPAAVKAVKAVPAPAAPKEAAAVWMRPGDLVPWDRNPRLITDEQVERVARSIRELGFGSAVLARLKDKRILAGHVRVRAALRLGLAFIPVRLIEIDDRRAEMMAVADNRFTELTPWDNTELMALLGEFGLEDAEVVGYSNDDLERLASDLLKEGGSGDGDDVEEDEAPDVPSTAITQPGDLWVLGEHRLYCGDSTLAASWQAVLEPGERVDLVFTDPPYGVDYIGKTTDALEVHNDGAAGLPALLGGAFDALLGVCRDGAVWYVCAPCGPNMQMFGAALLERELWRQSITWVKDAFVLGHSDYHYQQEQIFYGWKSGTHRPPPDRKQTTVWEFERPKRSEEHPTMKPVKLVAHALGLSSIAGELVADPFAGSGTTLVAAEQLGRRARCIEIGPEYCDVIAQRWEKLTGRKGERVPAVRPEAPRAAAGRGKH